MFIDKIGIFDIIAPVYALFYNKQKRKFQQIYSQAKAEIDLSHCIRSIDIGCGTGALCEVLRENGMNVIGIDTSKTMLKVAQKKNPNIKFELMDAQAELPYHDNAFDIAIASYVAHGLKLAQRKIMYKNMGRIAAKYVILHDYNQKRTPLTSIIEWLERGDYFNFIKVVEKELADNFDEIQILKVAKTASWYVCKPRQ